MKKKPSVLIVGAGPTGLMLACQLVLHKIPVRIIDKTGDHTTQSRALAVQARSLEIFDQMGIATKAISEGKRMQALNIYIMGQLALRVPLNGFSGIDTKYPFPLILEQYKTEALLIGFLKDHGCEVERGVELLSFKQNEKSVTAKIKYPNDEEESFRVEYLVGADGARSIVRNDLKIPFGGTTYDISLFVLDCDVKGNFPEDEITMGFSEKTPFVGFFPRNDGSFRVIGSINDKEKPPAFNEVPDSQKSKERNAEIYKIPFDYIANDFMKKTEMTATLSDPQWFSEYHSHHRYAATFHEQRCFLAGDAAHIHSPVGGQGMNTGLQDAYNLAWKLALVLKGKANEKLLDTYSQERIEVAKDLVHSTDKFFYFAINQHPAATFFKLHILPIILKIMQPIVNKVTAIRSILFNKISELGVNYRKGPLAIDASLGDFPPEAPAPGDRAPQIIQADLKDTFFHLFLFPGNVESTILEPIASIAQSYDFIKITLIPYSKNTKALYDQFGITSVGYYLIRPDMYVAYRSVNFDPLHLLNYLQRYFIQDV